MYEQTIENIKQFGNENQLLRLKVETLHFDFVFERDEDDEFKLTQTKAVIRVLGKTTKVVLNGEDTWEQAYERTRQHWSDYFKSYREGTARTDETRSKDRVRAKRHYSNKKTKEHEFLERR